LGKGGVNEQNDASVSGATRIDEAWKLVGDGNAPSRLVNFGQVALKDSVAFF